MSELKSPTNCEMSLLVIRAADMESSAAFYRAIGLQLERHAHPPCGDHYATVGDGCVLEIYPRRNPEVSIIDLTIGFRVSNVDFAVGAAVAHGGQLKRPAQDTSWGRTATVIDPDGVTVLLTQSS